jgi:two-component system nitrate/nitrite response regulator NarL
MEVVGEGATAADALKLAEDLAPDIVLLDLVLPGGGLEATAVITRNCPPVRILMLTASKNEQHVALALEAGARGYKGSSESELVETVRAVSCGESYVAPSLGARLLMRTRKRATARTRASMLGDHGQPINVGRGGLNVGF